MKLIRNWRKGTVVDIETDDLLDKLTKCHVLSFQMEGKQDPLSIKGDDLERIKGMLKWHIENETPIVGHNFILFDAPALEKVTGMDLSELMVIDTLALSWYLNTFRKQHGLDSFHEDYGIKKPEVVDWQNLTYEEYRHRCQEDVKINKALWEDFKNRLSVMYTMSKDMIDAGMVGGSRISPDEEIYIDSLVGKSVDEHIERFLTFLMFKMDTYRLQEKVGILLDKEHLIKAEKYFGDKVEGLKSQLESVMPKIPKYSKKKKPAKPFKQNGDLSTSGLAWEEVRKQYDERVVDEFGTRIVLLGKDEPTLLVNGEERSRRSEDIEEFQVFSKYEEPNANSSDQVKNFLYSHGWIPETFKEVKDKEADQAWQNEMKAWREIKGRKPKKPERPVARQVPQVTIAGEEGKVLCPSVERLAETIPEIAVYSNLNLFKHRHGVIKGLLEGMDEEGRIKATIGGLTNTLRVQHRNVVNLVGVDKIGGEEIRGSFIADPLQILLGSDLSSLEDRTKHHFMLPLDPEYVSTMMEDDFDPHLLMAVTAKFITEQEMNDYKAGNKKPHVTKGRKLGKSCLPVDNTQIMTRSGWKWFSEISVGEDVMSLNEDREQVWCKVQDKIFYENQPVKTISHRSWEVESTGNHRWLVDKRIRTKSNPRVKTFYSETDNLIEDMNIITTGKYVGGNSSVTPDQARLVGWILSDGYLSVSKLSGKTSQGLDGRRQEVRMSIAQSPKKYLDEIKELLSRLGMSFRCDKVTTSNDTISLSLRSSESRDFLKSVGLPLKSKHEIDYTSWITNLTFESLEAFIDAFWKADGWTTENGRGKKSLVIYQNLGNIYDAIRLALHLIGKNTISHMKSEKCASLSAQDRPHVTCQKLIKRETRETDVFCLTTENSNFLIKQNGVVTITGNCNYSAVYGAGAPKIAATAGVDESVGRQLHQAYWNLNWSVTAIAEEQQTVEFSSDDQRYSGWHKLWLINPINGFLYSLRARKDIFSTLCQGTGSFFFDVWVSNVLRRQKERFGIQKIQLQMHDELMFGFKDTPALRETFYSIVKEAIYDVNKEFKLRRTLDNDIQFGLRYSDIH